MKISISEKAGTWTVASVKKAIVAAWKKVQKDRLALLKKEIDRTEKDQIKPLEDYQLKQRSSFETSPGKSVGAQAEMLINLDTGEIDDGRSSFFEYEARTVVLIRGNLYITKEGSSTPGRLESMRKLKDTEALDKELTKVFCKLRKDADDYSDD